jgi:hypothetical protein
VKLHTNVFEDPQNDKKKNWKSNDQTTQIDEFFFSPANGVSSCEKENFTVCHFRWNVFSQPLEVKSLTLQEISTFLTGNFSKKNPPPLWFFCPLVQFNQSVILDKSIWTQPFCLGLFGWSFLLGFFYQFFWLNHCDNNIIWAN